MDKQETAKQVLAASFFVGGIVLIVLFIFTIGKDKGFYQQKFQVDMHFSNVGGLVEGAPVRLHGVNIGNVASIQFLDNELNGRKVSVKANILSHYKKQLMKGTRFTIQTEGVLGEKLVEIYSLEGQPLVDISRPVEGEDPISVTDMAQQFAELAGSFTKTADEFSKVDIVGLTDVMEESSRALLVTSEGVNGMMEDLKEITRKSKRVIDRLEEKIVDGNLFTVF
jgi:ABC-type transporter Mla subunit MlaD